MESHVGATNYRVKIESKTKTYHVNMLKKYISREPEALPDIITPNRNNLEKV